MNRTLNRALSFVAGSLTLGITFATFAADTATYTPDANGRLWKVTTPNWQIEYLYDAAGNVSAINRTVINATPVTLLAVHSRKTHGTAGTYDIPIDTMQAVTDMFISIEPRTINVDHLIAFQFSGPVTTVGTVTSTDSSGSPIGTASAVASGNEVLVTLSGIPTQHRVKISLTGVNGTVATQASLGFLYGDVNLSRAVNSSDIQGVRARSGQPTTAANFLFDVTANGAVNSSDLSAVMSQSGLSLLP